MYRLWKGMVIKMRRYFNTEGVCSPNLHYMVCLDDRLRQIKERYVDKGKYFVINRGRQYGKTTTLMALAGYLQKDYIVISMDFQEFGTEDFKDVSAFTQAFSKVFVELFRDLDAENCDKLIEPMENFIKEKEDKSLREMFNRLSCFCKNAPSPVVLFVDEVDSASNNQVFLDFLALLRKYYLKRDRKPTFHSVILAGVYDIRNLKLKLRPDEAHQYNSPWNIAADFDVRMSFTEAQIASMLREYENDWHMEISVEAVAKYIYDYTSGYPYLVSAICKQIDESTLFNGEEKPEDAKKAWTKEGVDKAVGRLLSERIPLFDSMVKQLDQYRDMRDVLEEIIYQGKKLPYSPDVKAINVGVMFGFLKKENNYVTIANRIFEMRLLNMFITEEAIHSEAFRYGQMDRTLFVKNNRLDMELVLKKFVTHYTDIYGDNDERFVEKYGRKFFLLYLKPIINGTGNYYLEAHTRDERRTDVIVDYLGEQFVVELKIWHGEEYNKRGEAQTAEYLDYYHKDVGYMISFNFNKKKETGVKRIRVGEKLIIEAVV